MNEKLFDRIEFDICLLHFLSESNFFIFPFLPNTLKIRYETPMFYL